MLLHISQVNYSIDFYLKCLMVELNQNSFCKKSVSKLPQLGELFGKPGKRE